ncbi:hypothetical protein EYC84_001781 [Monilinia fructicola]|uniref:Uncharacterized protein n=1 Tax=Monilinia fructicola TaxID=38448 RepID=A0A5M9JVA6_MONFR|nr:hypothetical protein EYC84_001781 [Monilinia fructicola]
MTLLFKYGCFLLIWHFCCIFFASHHITTFHVIIGGFSCVACRLHSQNVLFGELGRHNKYGGVMQMLCTDGMVQDEMKMRDHVFVV